MAAIADNLPEWNWYNFNTGYTLPEVFELLVGWGLAGLALGKIVLSS